MDHASALDIFRLCLHVLGATVWVGGQLVLAALVPALRLAGPGAPKAAANAFNRVAWPAFGLLVVTGVWNVLAEPAIRREHATLLTVKIILVVISGVSAYLHTRASGVRGLALWGGLAGLSALATLFAGVWLAA